MKSPQTVSLHTLGNEELLDLLKNNSWSEASQDIKAKILQILSSRGIDHKSNPRKRESGTDAFDKAKKHYMAFKRSSRRVFLCYLSFIVAITFSFFFETHWMVSTALLLIFGTLISFIIDALVQQTRFYKVVGGARSYRSPLVFFFLGMPLYFLMFLSIDQKMRARLGDLA